MNYLAELEALIFMSGDVGITIEQAALLLDAETTIVAAELDELCLLWQSRPSGLQIMKTAHVYRLMTTTAVYDVVQRFSELPMKTSLSQAALEILAIVAYRQPVTRTDIEHIRGVKSDRPLQTLVARELIAEIGRAETIGRPILYATTTTFLHAFGLQSLSDLPPEPTWETTDAPTQMNLFESGE